MFYAMVIKISILSMYQVHVCKYLTLLYLEAALIVLFF